MFPVARIQNGRPGLLRVNGDIHGKVAQLDLLADRAQRPLIRELNNTTRPHAGEIAGRLRARRSFCNARLEFCCHHRSGWERQGPAGNYQYDNDSMARHQGPFFHHRQTIGASNLRIVLIQPPPSSKLAFKESLWGGSSRSEETHGSLSKGKATDAKMWRSSSSTAAGTPPLKDAPMPFPRRDFLTYSALALAGAAQATGFGRRKNRALPARRLRGKAAIALPSPRTLFGSFAPRRFPLTRASIRLRRWASTV